MISASFLEIHINRIDNIEAVRLLTETFNFF